MFNNKAFENVNFIKSNINQSIYLKRVLLEKGLPTWLLGHLSFHGPCKGASRKVGGGGAVLNQIKRGLTFGLFFYFFMSFQKVGGGGGESGTCMVLFLSIFVYEIIISSYHDL